MSRSGQLRAVNDDLIRQLLIDPLYDIRQDGTVWTRKRADGGGVQEEWRLAGRKETNGYIQIAYRGHRLSRHRIIYQKFNGSLQCDLVVDHVNAVRGDDRPENLRLATARSNRIYMEQRKVDNYASKELSGSEAEASGRRVGVLEEAARSEDAERQVHGAGRLDQETDQHP